MNAQNSNKSPDDLADLLVEFTRAYQQHPDNICLREAACYQVQWKAMVCDIQEQDLFAGRLIQPPIGVIPQSVEGSLGYYFHPIAFDRLMNGPRLSDEKRRRLKEIGEFWKFNHTVAKTKRAYSEEMRSGLPSDLYMAEPGIAFTLWRMSGVQLDYAKLVSLGIPGLREEIRRQLSGSPDGSAPRQLYEAMLMALDTFAETCRHYAQQAADMAQAASEPRQKNEFSLMAGILEALPTRKPASFREGLQLIMLYNALDGARNYARLDDALGDLYCSDLDRGVIDEEGGIRLLTGFWALIKVRDFRYDSRIVIGGKGRINETHADRLALAIMETTSRVKENVPQLALRFHQGQNPALYKKALDVLGEGNPYPMLYNDDANIPAVQQAFQVPYDEAVHAIQFGCGEYVLNHRSVGTPSGVINLLQALLVTLHRGNDPITRKPMGMPLDRYEKYGDFETFRQLWAAYQEQVEYHVDLLAQHEELEYRYAGRDAAFLYSSMLMDDCIKRGQAIFSGGVRYLGGTLESYGNTNAADSLLAIRQLVYEQKRFTIARLVEMLDAGFAGYEREQKLMLNCPKYGNDNDTADAMLQQVHNHVCNYTRDQRSKTGLHSYLIVVINNDAHIALGGHTAASPDGRKALAYLNPGNAPVSGADKNGLTAFLNSVVKPSTAIHAGAVQNMKFSRELFTQYRGKVEALVSTYWLKGGAQAMFTIVSRGDLEQAMRHPENFQNLMVRVGGFCERFVNLPRQTQLEILSRTLY
ncbi:MAG: pyruvate formate lyase family protein [Limisphaerales bacterium]